MKTLDIVKVLISEASRAEVMSNVYNMSEHYVEKIEDIAGKLSLIFIKKIINQFKEDMPNLDIRDSNAFELMDDFDYLEPKLDELRIFMEYLKIAKNGNLGDMKDMSFREMVEVSEEWVDKVRSGSNESDFIEDGDIIIDYRKNGEGYYWVDLKTDYCEREGKNMRHCGKVFGTTIELYGGNLYSLRRYDRGADGRLKNSSHLTVAMANNGELRGLGGFANTKPKEKYHDYILDFLLYKEGGDYLVKSISYEVPDNFFSINDFNDSRLKKLAEKRKDLFKLTKAFGFLVNRGIVPELFFIFVHTIELWELPYYIDFGNRRTIVRDICSSLLNDRWYEYYNFDVNMPVREFIDNYMPDWFVEEVENKYEKNIDYLIDNDENFVSKIKRVMEKLKPENVRKIFIKEIIKSLSIYGSVIKFNEDGFTLEVDARDLDYDGYYLDGNSSWMWKMVVDSVSTPKISDEFEIFIDDGKIKFFNYIIGVLSESLNNKI